MAGPGRIPGRYNVLVEGEYEAFDHQIPVAEFIECLERNDVPEEVSIIGLGNALEDGDLAEELARVMDRRANDLEYQSPTLQFVVDGTFHRRGKTFDLRYNDELYSLQDVFGPQLERKEQGSWLVAPF